MTPKYIQERPNAGETTRASRTRRTKPRLIMWRVTLAWDSPRASLFAAERASTVPARKMKVGAQTWLTNLSRNQTRLVKGGARPSIPSPPWWSSCQKPETWSHAMMAMTMPLAKSMKGNRPIPLGLTSMDCSGIVSSRASMLHYDPDCFT